MGDALKQEPGQPWTGEEEQVKRIGALLQNRFGHRPLACVHTYGCQQNVSDGERLSGVLTMLGFEMTQDVLKADFALFNTCAVRENAQYRVFGNVGALKGVKEKRPAMLIAVCGCMTQRDDTAQHLRKSYPYVDLIFGANAASRVPGLLLRVLEGEKHVVDATPPEEGALEGLPIRRDGTVKAWLPIMQGCDNFCSYCIVPYVRGRERSRELDRVLEEAQSLLRDGYKEITLLGQNVNSYGKGLKQPADFPRLLYKLNALEGDFRIRFMTSHPKDCTPELIDAVAACPKVCGHIHLPVQSGSDRVLQQMNRRYTRQEYSALIARAREKIPAVSFTSDIMVGFPGETYADFQQTLELVEQVRFTALYTFLYSPRPGTRAAGMEDPVPAEEKSRWFAQLLDAQERIGRSIYEEQIGKVLRVLADGKAKQDGMLCGRTESGIIILFAGDPALIGQFVQVRMTQAMNWAIMGEVNQDPLPV